MATHFRKLTVKDIRNETAGCVSVAFHVPGEWEEEFRFIQGQNITLKRIIDGEEVRRSYSICSSPQEGELRIAVKHLEGGRFSGFVNRQLNVGDELELLPPTGQFFTRVEAHQQKNYLAFAAGSGITPVISILKTILATEPQSNFTLVYGNRNRQSIIFREQLEACKNRYMSRLALHHLLSREKTDIPLYSGRITAEKCEELSSKLIDLSSMDEIFLCGPEEMIFEIKDWLETKGVDKKKIHFELFNTPKTLAKKEPEDNNSAEISESSSVTIRSDGISFNFELPYQGESILDAAIKQGADLPFACKGGVCSTCRAKLVEGEVSMDVNYALEPDEIAAGFILTCQSHPRTKKVSIDYDTK